MMKLHEYDAKNGIAGYIEIFHGDGLPLIISQHGNGSEDGRNTWGAGSLSALEAYCKSTGHLPYKVLNNKLPIDVTKYNWAFPQTANGGLEDEAQVRFIQHTKNLYEPSKVVLMGLSMGGGKVWKLLDSPNRGIVDVYIPICGAADYYEPKNIGNIPLWAFVGENDAKFLPKTIFNYSLCVGSDKYGIMRDYKSMLPLTEDFNLYHDAGYKNLTVVKDAGHGVWGNVYGRVDLWNWIDNCVGLENEPTEPKEIDYSFLQEFAIDQLQLLSTFSSKISESNQLTLEIEKELENKADELLAYVMTKINSQL